MKRMITIVTLCFVVAGLSVSIADVSKGENSVLLQLPPAKDPVLNQVVRLELEGGFTYNRCIANYVRATGTSRNGWGFNTEVHLGLLSQYVVRSHVVFANERYVVEWIHFHNDSGVSQIESKEDLSETLSQKMKDIHDDWKRHKEGPTKDIFSGASKALLSSKFIGVRVQKKVGEDVLTFLKSRNDQKWLALYNDYKLPGTDFVVIYDLRDNNNGPVIRRLSQSGHERSLWQASGPRKSRDDDNCKTDKMYEIISTVCMALDKHVVPSGTLHEPGAVYRVTAHDLARIIVPFMYRVDASRGTVELKTDKDLRPFFDRPEKYFRVYAVNDKSKNALAFKKQINKDDLKAPNGDPRREEIDLQMDLSSLEAFIHPVGQKSYLAFVYWSGEAKSDALHQKNWWRDTSLSTAPKSEGIYLCSREQMKIDPLFDNVLACARKAFTEAYPGGACPF